MNKIVNDNLWQTIYKLNNIKNKYNAKEEIYNIYKEYFKKYLLNNNNIPIRKNLSKYSNGNCYFYALDLPIPDFFCYFIKLYCQKLFSLNVGDFANSKSTNNSELELLTNLEADLNWLNIKYYESTIYMPPTHGGYKIAIFIDKEGKDYHFIRQDQDMLWSQKLGWDDNEYYITDNPLSYLNYEPIIDEDNNIVTYEYIKTIEIVKPTLKRKK